MIEELRGLCSKYAHDFENQSTEASPTDFKNMRILNPEITLESISWLEKGTLDLNLSSNQSEHANSKIARIARIEDCVCKHKTELKKIYAKLSKPGKCDTDTDTLAEQARALGLKGEQLAAFVESHILQEVKGAANKRCVFDRVPRSTLEVQFR